jgi:hypothetical protein
MQPTYRNGKVALAAVEKVANLKAVNMLGTMTVNGSCYPYKMCLILYNSYFLKTKSCSEIFGLLVFLAANSFDNFTIRQYTATDEGEKDEVELPSRL